MISSPWGHDYAWERAVVRKIRDGGAAPECYALYEGAISHETSERAGIPTGYIYHDEEAAAVRALKSRNFRQSLHDAQQEAMVREAARKAAGKAKAEAYRAERAAAKAAHEAQLAKWAEEDRKRREEYALRQPIERAEREAYALQEMHIMSSKWLCTVCGGKSRIERKNPGYQIQCTSCGKQAWGSHKSLWEVLNK